MTGRRRKPKGDDHWEYDWDNVRGEFFGGQVSSLDTDPDLRNNRRPRRIGFRQRFRVRADCVLVERRVVK